MNTKLPTYDSNMAVVSITL